MTNLKMHIIIQISSDFDILFLSFSRALWTNDSKEDPERKLQMFRWVLPLPILSRCVAQRPNHQQLENPAASKSRLLRAVRIQRPHHDYKTKNLAAEGSSREEFPGLQIRISVNLNFELHRTSELHFLLKLRTSPNFRTFSSNFQKMLHFGKIPKKFGQNLAEI